MLLLRVRLLALSLWGLLAIFTKALGYLFPSKTPLGWSSSTCVCSPWAMEEAGENTLFHMVWVVRREVQISVCVGGLSVDAYVKGSIILVVEECVQER